MKTATAQQVSDMMRSDPSVAVLDVLPPEKYSREHVPGAHNVPFSAESFRDRVEQGGSGKGRPVVVYCADEECSLSPKAAQELESAGYENVIDFTGGMAEWKEAGLPTE
mgnify:CR=1 FL=1